MGLSFKDSLGAAMRKEKEERENIGAFTPTMFMAMPNAQTSEADSRLYANQGMKAIDTVNWTMKAGCRQYDDYGDVNVSAIDDVKSVVLNPKQLNITQEENSQYIPFEMDRYYDGFDLLKTNILIHYVNSKGQEDRDDAVNIHYNDNKIRFAWLLNKNATAVSGVLKFEIEAHGVNSKNEPYTWRTKPNEELNVLTSLAGNGDVIQADPSWISSFMTQVKEQVSLAQTATAEAKAASSTAGMHATNAQNSANSAKTTVDTAKQELAGTIESTVANKMATALIPYYTKTQVDDLLKNVDISAQLQDIQNQIDNIDGLANFDVTYDGSTMKFMNGTKLIKSIPIQSDPSTQWIDNYTKTVVDKKVGDLKTEIGTTHATKSELNAVSSTANSNKTSVDLLSTKVTELEATVGKVDTSPRLTYDATYDTQNIYTLWEIKNEGNVGTEVRTPKAQFKIQGGGGGGTGGTSSTLKIEYITMSPIVATLADKVVIKYRFSGTDSSGDIVAEGAATWRVGGVVVANNTAISGENSFDITNFLSIGTQKVTLSVVDAAGTLVTKSWTVQKIDVRLESSFNDKLTYPIGGIVFDYTPFGAVDKTIHFKLDGTEIHTVKTVSSGVPMSYEIPVQTHGSHLLEVYITAMVNGKSVESNHIVKDIIWYDPKNQAPVIGCANTDISVTQYDALNIEYTVYDPSTDTPTVTLAVDGTQVSTLVLNSNTNVWQYKAVKEGLHTLTITCGSTVKTIKVNVSKLSIDVVPITAGLAFDFNPSGKSNDSTDRNWTDRGVTMTVSNNFDWVNGGYQIDKNGDQYFCVKSGTTATINYNLFSDDPKKNGKEFKVVFKTTNVRNRDTSFLSCMNGNIGVDMKIEDARIYSSNNNLYSPYCEDDIIEFEFNINKNTDIPMVMTYEDGVGNRPMIYSADASFMQSVPQPITIGSKDCDVHIYRMKAYSNSLNDRDILSNFIADARNADEMVARYTRNQIYDENGALTPEILATKCPDLRIIMIDAPWFTNDKKNKVADTNITMIYKNGDPILDNWTCTGALHSGRT